MDEKHFKPSLLDRTALFSMIGAMATWVAYTFDSSYNLAAIVQGSPQYETPTLEKLSAFFTALCATTVAASITYDIKNQRFTESKFAQCLLHPISTATTVGYTILGAKILDQYFNITNYQDTNAQEYTLGIMTGIAASVLYKRSVEIETEQPQKSTLENLV